MITTIINLIVSIGLTLILMSVVEVEQHLMMVVIGLLLYDVVKDIITFVRDTFFNNTRNE